MNYYNIFASNDPIYLDLTDPYSGHMGKNIGKSAAVFVLFGILFFGTGLAASPPVDAMKGQGVPTNQFGAATKNIVCGDRLCSEVGQESTQEPVEPKSESMEAEETKTESVESEDSLIQQSIDVDAEEQIDFAEIDEIEESDEVDTEINEEEFLQMEIMDEIEELENALESLKIQLDDLTSDEMEEDGIIQQARQPNEDQVIFRAQIKLKTDNKKYANTNDAIRIKLNDKHSTWLDHPGNDFEKGDSKTYDLMLGGINTLKDIKKIVIAKNGDNGWCIKEFSLKLNGKTVFTKKYSKCHWLDSEPSKGRTNSLTISSSELRNNSLWSNANGLSYQPSKIKAKTFSNIFTTIVGDFHHSNPSYWGKHNSHVTLYRDGGPSTGDLKAKVKTDFKWAVPGKDARLQGTIKYTFSCDYGYVDVRQDKVDYKIYKGKQSLLGKIMKIYNPYSLFKDLAGIGPGIDITSPKTDPSDITVEPGFDFTNIPCKKLSWKGNTMYLR